MRANSEYLEIFKPLTAKLGIVGAAPPITQLGKVVICLAPFCLLSFPCLQNSPNDRPEANEGINRYNLCGVFISDLGETFELGDSPNFQLFTNYQPTQTKPSN
jgi:hypothetical protein